jgi:hypothetical protein
MTILDQFGYPVDPTPQRKPKIGFAADLYLPNGEMKPDPAIEQEGERA